MCYQVYESEMAPEGLKETARQHPRADPVIPDNHVLPSSTRDVPEDQQKESSDSPLPSNIKAIAETVTEKLTPAYTTVAEATQTIASKIQGCVAATAAATPSKPITGEQQVWDKGVSVKEYLMNKLEPGEDERALSQVISEVISPRKSPGEMGVVEKVREAVTLLLRNGEYAQSRTSPPPKSTSNIPISSKLPSNTNSISTTSSSPSKVPATSTRSAPRTHLASKSASQLPVSTNSASQVTFSSKAQYIPISTNAYEGWFFLIFSSFFIFFTFRNLILTGPFCNVVNMEEESHGRILQTNWWASHKQFIRVHVISKHNPDSLPLARLPTQCINKTFFIFKLQHWQMDIQFFFTGKHS